MQGSVLNVGAFQGLILGDDGVRYTFTYAEWRDSNVPLQIGTGSSSKFVALMP